MIQVPDSIAIAAGLVGLFAIVHALQPWSGCRRGAASSRRWQSIR